MNWRRSIVVFTMGLLFAVLMLSQQIQAKTTSDDIRSITISAAGDCTLSSDRAQPKSANFFTKYHQKGADYFLKKVKSVFEKDDLTIVNFEGTLSKRGARADKTWAFRGKPKYVKVLQKGSVEAVGLSNNHVRDYGKVSYIDTVNYLKKAGIAYSSDAKVCVKLVKGVRVGMVSISSVEPKVGDPAVILKKAMKEVKKQGTDIIIVNMHSGIEYTFSPTALQKQLAHQAVKLGANLVIGHHPHVIQSVEKYKGAYIAYSLGNFCFGGNTNPRDKDSMIFQQTFSLKNGELVGKPDARLIPCRLSSHDSYNDYQPKVVGGKQKKRILARMRNFSKGFHVSIGKDGKLN